MLLTKRQVGNTGIWVTPIGLGGAWLGRTAGGFEDGLAIATVHHSLKQGINLIDTSPLYGESERRIGIALKDWFARGGKRDEIVLSSKTGTRTRPYEYTASATRRSVEESLRLLNVEYLDICHIHDPSDLTPVLAPNGALNELKKLKGEGLIRAIGLGVRDHSFHRRMKDTGDLEVSLTYRDYNLLYQSALEGVILPASQKGLGVFNATVVIGGLLADPRTHQVSTTSPLAVTYTPLAGEVERAKELGEFARSHGISLLALNLQFCLRQPHITSTLLGVATPEELDTDMRALDEEINPDCWAGLSSRFGISCSQGL